MASIDDIVFLLVLILILIVMIVLFFFRIIRIPGMKANYLDPRPYLDNWFMRFSDGRLKIEEVKRFQGLYLIRFENSAEWRPMRYKVDFDVETPFAEDGYVELVSNQSSDGFESLPSGFFSGGTLEENKEKFDEFVKEERRLSIDKSIEEESEKSHGLKKQESHDEKFMEGQIDRLKKVGLDKKKKKKKSSESSEVEEEEETEEAD